MVAEDNIQHSIIRARTLEDTLRHLLFASLLLFTTHSFAQSQGIDGVRFEATQEEIVELQNNNSIEVVPVRPPFDGETESAYSKYLYATAGMDLPLMPGAFFLGLGVQDPRGIISVEGQVRLNILGAYSGQGGTRNNAVGAAIKGYVFPFRILNSTRSLEGLYYAEGIERYSEIEGSGTSYLSSAHMREIGYELGGVGQIGFATGNTTFRSFDGTEEENTLYLIKFAIKLQAPRR
jgi:hypothetical protein